MSESLTPEPSPPPQSRGHSTTAPSSPTPLQPTRCGRIRRAVTKFGSMIDSDLISDSEDGAGPADDDDEGYESATADMGASEDEDFAMGGEESDEGSKKKKGKGKKANSKKVNSRATVKVTSTTKKSAQPKISTAFKAAKPASKAKAATAKLEVKVKPAPVVLGKSVKPAGSNKRKNVVDDENKEGSADEAETTKDRDDAIDTGEETKSDAKISSKPSCPPLVAMSNSSTALAKKARTGVSLAPSSKASASSTKTATTSTSSKKGFVPLKKTGTVELKPAATKAGKVNESGNKVQGSKADQEVALASKGEVQAESRPESGGDEEGEDAQAAKSTEGDGQKKVNENPKGKGKTLAKANKAAGKAIEEQSAAATVENEGGDENEISKDLDNEEEQIKDKPSPAKKARSKKSAVTPDAEGGRTASGSSTSSTPRKLAPAEKLTTMHRLAIVEALFKPDVLKQADYATISDSYDNEPNASKLSRHCREVLRPDVGAYIRDGAMPKSKKDSQGAITVEQRVELWHAVCKVYEKADWKGIEETTGMTTTKLKRHFRDVMRKDVEKEIKAK